MADWSVTGTERDVLLANGLATLAMIRQATGDPAGALAAIAEADQASPGPAGLFNPVPAQRARVLLAQDRAGQALALLDRLHAAAAAQDRAGSLIEIGALRALARLRRISA